MTRSIPGKLRRFQEDSWKDLRRLCERRTNFGIYARLCLQRNQFCFLSAPKRVTASFAGVLPSWGAACPRAPSSWVPCGPWGGASRLPSFQAASLEPGAPSWAAPPSWGRASPWEACPYCLACSRPCPAAPWCPSVGLAAAGPVGACSEAPSVPARLGPRHLQRNEEGSRSNLDGAMDAARGASSTSSKNIFMASITDKEREEQGTH